MSEKTKDDIIEQVYNDPGGFGTVQTPYKQIKAFDGRRGVNSGITIKDVKEWLFKNVENIAKLRGYDSFIYNAANEEYQMDHIFFGRDKEKT